VKTPLSRVSASLCSVTCLDHRRPPRGLAFDRGRELLRRPDFAFRFLDAFD
jgi:hypothetical protein